MIGKLKGRIDQINEDSLIIDVGGVGYLVYCDRRTLIAAGHVGEAAQLIIETHVREDHIHLYGFLNQAERDWFRLLTTVQGVGVRMGLAILGTFTPDQVQTIIAAQDKKQLTAVSGVGPKLAERIITELKSKVGTLPTSGLVIEHPSAKSARPMAASADQASDDAVSALVNLGYGRTEAYSAIARAKHQHAAASLDELIRFGLKELAS